MRFAYSSLSLAILAALSTSSFAKESNYQEPVLNETTIKFNTIIVEAQQENEVGKTIYSKEDLEKTPNSSKNITDFLKVNPNVQFSNNSLQAGNQGDLKPAEISINGGLPYNNAFLIDGMNINNQINPVGTSSVNATNLLMGSSQQANINTDLICELEVLDSNVSAAYGSFSGGVVSAKTCIPRTEVGKIHGNVSYDYENSDWNRYNYFSVEEQAEFDEATESGSQKDYIKQGLSTNIYGRMTEKLGFNAFASRRSSDIQLQPALAIDKNYDQSRQSDNLGFNLYYQANDNTEIQFGVQHFESDDLYFQNNVLHDGINMISQSDNINLKIDQKFDQFSLKQSLNYQEKNSERKSSSSVSIPWFSSTDKNWSNTSTASEGDFGTIAQEHKKLTYQLDAEINPIKANNWTHNIIMGAGYSHDDANWNRPTDHIGYSLQQMGYGSDCIRRDGSTDPWCDASYISGSSIGQYHTRRTINPASEIDVRQDSWNAYLENKMQWKNYVKAGLGLRVDYDSLTKSTNLAPRSSLNVMPFGDQRLSFTTGWNRYYADNAFTYQLQDGINNLDQAQKRVDINSEWENTTNTNAVQVNRSQLDRPFSDEIVAGIGSELNNWKYQFKYVHRDYKNEIRLTPIVETADLYDRTYANAGSAEADVFSLAINNMQALPFLGTKHYFTLAADYTDVVRNFNSYDTGTLNEDKYVLHNSKVILNADRPAVNFNQPLTARLQWDFELNNLPLKVSNLFRYRSSYDYYARSTLATADRFEVDGHTVRYSYVEDEASSRFNWDIRTTFDLPITQNEKLIFGLTVNNVLNKKQSYVATSESDSISRSSELGRQFIADVTFKF
ncbi:hypothetical protein F906_01768 [Acinetobacter pseudolwoffii]|uniref:TonB-dependent receptor plug domain-containing protein n=1 Tax=Acinetobacter pseudolwoffii TaxID=2053287 RepID=N9KRU7_9GAMM|nr:TonB-dependent receptor plug domain-containing protein [Acinetobacter pseudolwoffii]ENW86703.1 hypothetical protein F906_01768 [Acinetobacter pseudolwoffii]